MPARILAACEADSSTNGERRSVHGGGNEHANDSATESKIESERENGVGSSFCPPHGSYGRDAHSDSSSGNGFGGGSGHGGSCGVRCANGADGDPPRGCSPPPAIVHCLSALIRLKTCCES